MPLMVMWTLLQHFSPSSLVLLLVIPLFYAIRTYAVVSIDVLITSHLCAVFLGSSAGRWRGPVSVV